jgi:hypothetical protein
MLNELMKESIVKEVEESIRNNDDNSDLQSIAPEHDQP